MSNTIIDNNQDTIDSRNIIARINELEAIEERDEEEQKELETLNSIRENVGQADEFESGMPLIRESYFTKYAQKLAKDVCNIPRDSSFHWPLTHINWETAAGELMFDYWVVDFDGVTYYVR